MIRHFKPSLVFLLAPGLMLMPCACLCTNGDADPVQYIRLHRENAPFSSQHFGMAGLNQTAGPDEVKAESAGQKTHLIYRFTGILPCQTLPLGLEYGSDVIGGAAGPGWTVSLLEPMSGKPILALLEMPALEDLGDDLFLLEARSGDWIEFERSSQTSLKSTHIWQGWSIEVHQEKNRLTFTRENLKWQFNFAPPADPRPQLFSIHGPGLAANLIYNQERSLLEKITWRCLDNTSGGPHPPQVDVDFHFDSDSRLSQLQLTPPIVDRHPHHCFRYAGTKERQTTADLALSGFWLEDSENKRWILPDLLSIQGRPDLEFQDLNKDGHVDLLLTDANDMRTYLWAKSEEKWRQYPHYLPKEPLYKSGRGTGVHWLNLAKIHTNTHLNTFGFRALATATYQPDPGLPQRLTYRFTLFFPKIRNGQIWEQPNGQAPWEEESDSRLQFPIPLQFSGKEPWPPDKPLALEQGHNQAVKLIQLEQKYYLFYAALRYRNLDTETEMLAAHRNTGNCISRYLLEWQGKGQRQRIQVELCQGVWLMNRSVWNPDTAGPDPLWARLDAAGSPGYSLPELAENFAFHYESWRAVTFVPLKPGSLFALVTGPACEDCGNLSRPKANHVLRLVRGGQWRIIAQDSPLHPPPHLLAQRNLVFKDLDGDQWPDAIEKSGRRRVFLNPRGQGPWREEPRLKLPLDCTLNDGSCRLTDLNGDDLPDLFIGRGRKVYLNQAWRTNGTLTAFTDDQGQWQRCAAQDDRQ